VFFQVNVKTELIELVERNAEIEACVGDIGVISGDVGLVTVTRGITEIVPRTDAVQCEVRVQITEVIARQDITVIEGKIDAFAGAENVVLRDVGIENNALYLRVAHAGLQVAEAFSLME